MNKLKFFFFLVLTTVVAVLMFSSTGCEKKATEPETVQPITEDLFPLIVGRKLTFGGFLRDARTDANIEATGAVYEARMTVVATGATTPFGVAHVISDSQRVPTGVATPPTTWVVGSFFIQRPAPTGSGNFSFLTNIGRFYRSFGIARTDSLQWILLVKQDAGVGVEYTGFDQSYTGAAGPVRLQIVAKIEGREQLTLAGQSFNPYRIKAQRKIYLGGAATPSVQAETATIWLQPNVGIVRFIFNADGETRGFFREFKSKNF